MTDSLDIEIVKYIVSALININENNVNEIVNILQMMKIDKQRVINQ